MHEQYFANPNPNPNPPYLRVWMTAPPPSPRPPLSQGLDPELSCTYIILVAILPIIDQLINRFSSSVFSPCPDLTVTASARQTLHLVIQSSGV